jgi:NAD(P)-dependent dehydrogenase (short-subunit alcohol dehydrogenase family)
MIMSEPRKIALITGANKGIGLGVARGLGKAGQLVLVGSRNPANGTKAADQLRAEGIDAVPVELDLDRPDTIAAAAEYIRREFGRLDVLINNAGIIDAGDGPPGAIQLDALRRVMETNFIGAVAVAQAMLPLLRAAPAARIVNVSSGLGSITLNNDPEWEYEAVKLLGYNASKAAMNMLTVQLAWELRDTAIKVNSADPGYTATDLNGNSGHQTVEEGAAETIRLALLPANGPSGGFFETAGPRAW